MNNNYFNDILKMYDIFLNDNQIEKFNILMKELIETNKYINLTRIIEENNILEKHFLDSLISNKYIKDNSKLIDIGSGAGFPGLPLKIYNDTLNITMVDSVNKKVDFINKTILELGLKNVVAIHSRAEDLGNKEEYREKFDVAISRAVANMSTLVELLIPLVKVGGLIICIKGIDIQNEVNESLNAINLLGGSLIKIDEYKLPSVKQKYNIIVIEKIKNTPVKYPRKAGIPSKDPLH